MQEADRTTIETRGVSALELMARAGRAAATLIRRRWPRESSGRVSVLAGPGNNGGDGFVVARELSDHGAAVRIYVAGRADHITGAARTQADALSPHVPIVSLASADAWQRHRLAAFESELVVDALFGTGLSRPLQGLAAAMVIDINDCAVPVVSIDLPSGLSADRTDVPGPAVMATMTIAFAAPKLPLMITPACAHVGALEVVDIGIPREVIEALPGPRVETVDPARARALVRPRRADSHKGTYGHVFVVGGSRGKIGAPALTARAALRSGAGLVTVAIPASCWAAEAGFTPEVMTDPVAETAGGELADAAIDRLLSYDAAVLAIGPGLGGASSTVSCVRQLVSRAAARLVLDADALNAIAGQPDVLRSRRAPDIVITPHPGEMARLTGQSTADVQKDRLNVARAFARTFGVLVVLKGSRTIIAAPDGDAFVNTTGNPGMATAGMGDVLTGVIAAWMASGLSARDAAVLGTFLHGLAGDRAARTGHVGLLASDLIDGLPAALESLLDSSTARG